VEKHCVQVSFDFADTLRFVNGGSTRYYLPYNLNSTASFGVGEKPLRFTVRFLISLMGDKDIRLRNKVDFSLDLSAATVSIDTLLKINETSFFNFPRYPERLLLDGYSSSSISRLEGNSHAGIKFEYCLSQSCRFAQETQPQYDVSFMHEPRDKRPVKVIVYSRICRLCHSSANTILDYATKLLGGEFL
jgi:hypothetical protein